MLWVTVNLNCQNRMLPQIVKRKPWPFCGGVRRMRHFLLLPALAAFLALPARAQVTVDLNALDQLKKPAPGQPTPGQPTPAKQAAKPGPKPKPPSRTATKPAAPEATQPSGTAPAAASTAAPAAARQPPGFHAPLPPMPGAPPPDAALAPLLPPVPLAKRSPASGANQPVAADAKGAGQAFPGGMRITFGDGQGELSPTSEQAIKLLVSQAPKSETVSYNVLAYASGTPEDPSTARRLSLARGLAVRSVLMSAGVPSARIYVRALGATSGSATPDRVDVGVLGANAPPPDLALPPPPEATIPAEAPAEPAAPDKPTPDKPTTQGPTAQGVVNQGAGKTP